MSSPPFFCSSSAWAFNDTSNILHEAFCDDVRPWMTLWPQKLSRSVLYMFCFYKYGAALCFGSRSSSRFPAKKRWHSPPRRVALELPHPLPDSVRADVRAYADVRTNISRIVRLRKFDYQWCSSLWPSAANELHYNYDCYVSDNHQPLRLYLKVIWKHFGMILWNYIDWFLYSVFP